MSIEDLKQSINTLIDEIQARPDARAHLHAELRRKIAELEAQSLGLPNTDRTLTVDNEDESEDLFDNMPV